MINTQCQQCDATLSASHPQCPECGFKQPNERETHPNFSEITEVVNAGARINIKSGLNKTLKWFVLVNAAVMLSVALITAGKGVAVVPFLLVIGGSIPFGALFLSKWLAVKSHDMHIVSSLTQNDREKKILALVDSLRKKAGIDVMPEVGIYESDDMNAFATGRSKNNALIAFSTALLDKMSDAEIAAVAAHEIAHIANGDMITLAIVQAVTNAVVLLVSIPMMVVRHLAASETSDWLFNLFIAVIQFVMVSVMLFLGNLVVKAFSRKREYEADRLAAQLLDKESMISALSTLGGEVETISYNKRVASYAALKISSPRNILGELFSTHPSLEKRIQALTEITD